MNEQHDEEMEEVWKEYQQQQRKAAFTSLSDGHPVWIALTGILKDHLDNAVEEVTTRDVQPLDMRSWHAGYLSHILDLRRELQELHRPLKD